VGDQGKLRLVADQAEHAVRMSGSFRVLLSASLITTTDEIPVKLRDLSCDGAAIEAMRLPSAGTDVILKRGGLELFATVSWSAGRRAQLTFESAISEAELLKQIHSPRSDAMPSPDAEKPRPGFRQSALSEEERKLASDWSNPAGRLAYRD
jgi:hypothetical protein